MMLDFYLFNFIYNCQGLLFSRTQHSMFYHPLVTGPSVGGIFKRLFLPGKVVTTF